MRKVAAREIGTMLHPLWRYDKSSLVDASHARMTHFDAGDIHARVCPFIGSG
jgi:hypothetical protein